MNEHLRDRILRKLETLSDERGYQVLDYAEFLESRYAERASPANAFTRFTENIEDTLRAGKVSASAIAETVGFMNRAANVLTNAVESGRSVATNVATGIASTVGIGSSSSKPTASVSATPGASAPSSGPPASSPAEDVKAPGSSGEKL